MPQIDFDAVLAPAFICVNRACIFMGFGTNAARDPNFKTYQLPELPQFQVVPAELPDETLAEFKDEFGIWVVGNGLRELVEAWELVLDGFHAVILQSEFWAASKSSSPNPEQYTKRELQFTKLGISKKFDLLEKKFEIHFPFRIELESLKKARNCLTHRFGNVTEHDLNEVGCLAISWRALELFGRHKDGSEFLPNIEGPYPIDFPVDSPFMMRPGVRRKRVSLGEKIHFEPREIKGLCYTYLVAVQQAKEAFVKYIEGIGGVVNYNDPSDSNVS
jgi:hypothetical protein